MHVRRKQVPERLAGRLSRPNRRDFLKLSGLAASSALLSTVAQPLDAPANIVLVFADAVRLDHVSSYGYGRATTPNLDAYLASQGARFSQATTACPWTYPSNAAFFTGREPISLEANWNNTVLPDGVQTLAGYLKSAGYYTAGFVSAPFIRGSLGFSAGFDVYDDSLAVGHATSYQGIAGELSAQALNWLANSWAGGQPLFLCLYFFDPHTWYHPPAPYDTLFAPPYAGSVTPAAFRDAQDVVAGQLVLQADDLAHIQALYDGEIAYFDHHLGNLLGYLDDNHFLDNAVVAFTSDHGDSFGEHGVWTHGSSLYEEALRVPLLLRYPGVVSPGLVVGDPVHSGDLMPAILEWAGVPLAPEIEAVSLRPLAEGQTQPARDIFGELDGEPNPAGWAAWNAPYENLRCLRRGAWKYIHHVGFTELDELYQVEATAPYERQNVLADEPAIAGDLLQAVLGHYGPDPYRLYVPAMRG
jgi:arylsulfatase A-like enzyme